MSQEQDQQQQQQQTVVVTSASGEQQHPTSADEGWSKKNSPISKKDPEPGAGAAVEMDIHVGLWRGKWPKQLNSIISIEDNLLVRYDSNENVLDMVEFDAVERTVCAVAEVPLGALELPPFHSVHHFLAKGEPYLFCLATDRRRYVIFKAGNKRFGAPTSGTLMFSPSHCVVFKYRHLHYLLCYSSRSGEYQVIAMAPLCNPKMDVMAATVSQGRFRPGWTDVIWKGTTHVRCTRQKFFCYNCETGEVAFECVWVRGASTSSSVASQEHVTMPIPPPPDDKPETEAQKILKKKGCVAMPLHLSGRTVCLLYSHSALKRSADPSSNRGTGSSRLPASQKQAISNAASAAVAENAAVLLQKRVFAHEQPWSHFCMLAERGDASGNASGPGAGGDLLCYSATSGDVWISQLFQCKRGHSPIREVTLRDDVGREVNDGTGSKEGGDGSTAASGGGGRGDSHRVVKFSEEQQTLGRSQDGSGGAAGGGGGLSSSQRLGYRQLTTQTLRQVAEIPMSVEEYADAGPGDDYAFPVDPADEDSKHSEGGAGASKDRKHRHSRSGHRGSRDGDARSERTGSAQSGRLSQQSGQSGQSRSRSASKRKDRPSSSAFRNPVSPRPASSGRSVRQRLAELETTGDYHTDILRFVKHLQSTDFAEDSPTAKLDLQEIIQEMEEPTEKEILQGVRAQSARSRSGNSFGASGSSRDDDGGKPPWKSCLGEKERIPAMWLLRHEHKQEQHRLEEVPSYKLTDKALLRLFQPPMTREQFQEKHIGLSMKKMHEADISVQGRKARDLPDGPMTAGEVDEMVKKLAENDIENRERKKLAREKKYCSPIKPEPLPHKTELPKEKFDHEEQEAFVRRVAVDGVHHQKQRRELAEKKAHAPLKPPHPPLKKAELENVNKRLTDMSYERRSHEKQKILASMDKGVIPPPTVRPSDQVAYSSKRLFMGKTERQAAEMHLTV